MRKVGIGVGIIGALGVLLGAFGAHSVKGKISDIHYAAYRVGIEYLFFHLAPLLYIASQPYHKQLQRTYYIFILGIVCFTGSNILMTTEAIHHIHFRFLWPITPIGGVLFVVGWILLAKYFFQKEN